MRIAIDARFYNESGVGRYLRNLISNLKSLDEKNEYFIILLQKDFEQFSNTENFQAVKADFKWYGVKEQIRLPKLLYGLKLDLVHFPHFNVPIFFDGKFVVTIHDLIHQHFQMKRATRLNPLLYQIKQLGYRKIFYNAISKSEKILVPSNYVRDLLIKEGQVSQSKIVVTYEGVDNSIISIGKAITKSEIDNVMKKIKIKLPYIFYVGNAHPHKNIEGLIKAFLNLRERCQLVLSGYDHYFWQKIKSEYQNEDIIYTGQVNDKELVALYKSAKCFVLPSFEEGFGITILEAMSCKTPVISSNVGSLPEIGKDAVLYFNPYKIEDIEEKIALVFRSEKLRRDLIEKGSKRVKLFSWKKLAEQTLEVYAKCL